MLPGATSPLAVFSSVRIWNAIKSFRRRGEELCVLIVFFDCYSGLAWFINVKVYEGNIEWVVGPHHSWEVSLCPVYPAADTQTPGSMSYYLFVSPLPSHLLTTQPALYLSVCPSVYHPYICRSVNYTSIYPFVWLAVCLPIYQSSICLSVCLCSKRLYVSVCPTVQKSLRVHAGMYACIYGCMFTGMNMHALMYVLMYLVCA